MERLSAIEQLFSAVAHELNNPLQSIAGVVVEIADDGPGVPPELAGKIFEPPFSTKEGGKGSGLGLSIALGIAQAHGALVLVPTETGVSFRLTLPCLE
jgi:signal transduction histidine kinase